MAPQFWVDKDVKEWTLSKEDVIPETKVHFRLFSKRRIDLDKQQIISDFRMMIRHDDGSTEIRTVNNEGERIVYHADLLKLLDSSGYRGVEEFGGYDKKPFEEGERYIIVLAEKIATNGTPQ